MRGRIFFLMVGIGLLWSCEDPTTLPVSKDFSNSKMQTVFVDTFSVFTSTVQLDSVLTDGTNTGLLGKYNDSYLGKLSASTYLQLGYNTPFSPIRTQDFLDSVAIIIPYSHYYTGDTTKDVEVRVYQLREQMLPRKLPSVGSGELKLSVFNLGQGFFNNTEFKTDPLPIVSKTVKFLPHRDSIQIRFPDSFGKRWFKIAKGDSVTTPNDYFTNPFSFFGYFFFGFKIDVNPAGSDASVVGLKARQIKLRFYYRHLQGDIWKSTHYDFKPYSGSTTGGFLFNHIDYDRTGTKLASAQKMQPIPTEATDNICYVQNGTGLVTKLEFPSVKNFFLINNGVVLNDAYLEVLPVRGSYPISISPPSALQLYLSDGSSLPLTAVAGASLVYDRELGVNTLYRYPLFPFLYGQLKNNTNFISPLILGPLGTQGSSVQRVCLGGRYYSDPFYPQNKIKLKIYYSYALN